IEQIKGNFESLFQSQYEISPDHNDEVGDTLFNFYKSRLDIENLIFDDLKNYLTPVNGVSTITPFTYLNAKMTILDDLLQERAGVPLYGILDSNGAFVYNQQIPLTKDSIERYKNECIEFNRRFNNKYVVSPTANTLHNNNISMEFKWNDFLDQELNKLTNSTLQQSKPNDSSGVDPSKDVKPDVLPDENTPKIEIKNESEIINLKRILLGGILIREGISNYSLRINNGGKLYLDETFPTLKQQEELKKVTPLLENEFESKYFTKSPAIEKMIKEIKDSEYAKLGITESTEEENPVSAPVDTDPPKDDLADINSSKIEIKSRDEFIKLKSSLLSEILAREGIQTDLLVVNNKGCVLVLNKKNPTPQEMEECKKVTVLLNNEFESKYFINNANIAIRGFIESGKSHEYKQFEIDKSTEEKYSVVPPKDTNSLVNSPKDVPVDTNPPVVPLKDKPATTLLKKKIKKQDENPFKGNARSVGEMVVDGDLSVVNPAITPDTQKSDKDSFIGSPKRVEKMSNDSSDNKPATTPLKKGVTFVDLGSSEKQFYTNKSQKQDKDHFKGNPKSLDDEPVSQDEVKPVVTSTLSENGLDEGIRSTISKRQKNSDKTVRLKNQDKNSRHRGTTKTIPLDKVSTPHESNPPQILIEDDGLSKPKLVDSTDIKIVDTTPTKLVSNNDETLVVIPVSEKQDNKHKRGHKKHGHKNGQITERTSIVDLSSIIQTDVISEIQNKNPRQEVNEDLIPVVTSNTNPIITGSVTTRQNHRKHGEHNKQGTKGGHRTKKHLPNNQIVETNNQVVETNNQVVNEIQNEINSQNTMKIRGAEITKKIIENIRKSQNENETTTQIAAYIYRQIEDKKIFDRSTKSNLETLLTKDVSRKFFRNSLSPQQQMNRANAVKHKLNLFFTNQINTTPNNHVALMSNQSIALNAVNSIVNPELLNNQSQSLSQHQ
ncbi:MAG: hypothetical protein LBC92_02765, partial [Rickettsiales bacterium]|nr:hypothetical protein [Rickettsiales bacterium]